MNINDAFSGFCIISNGFIILRTSRYDELNNKRSFSSDLKSQIKALTKKAVSRHKNPEDALGDFMSELDIDKLGRDIDFVNIEMFISHIAKTTEGDTFKNIFKEDILLDICDIFDTTICELTKTLMEKYPDKIDITFIKQNIKPLITKLQKEKYGYEQHFSGCFYKPIFDYL
jgi:hypothetical protein